MSDRNQLQTQICLTPKPSAKLEEKKEQKLIPEMDEGSGTVYMKLWISTLLLKTEAKIRMGVQTIIMRREG